MEFIALVIAIVAAFIARKATMRTEELNARLTQLEASLAGGIRPAGLATETSVAPPIVPETTASETETAERVPSAPPPLPTGGAPYQRPVEDTARTSAEAPEARIGFEERIGTRWVVWVGGLTLALGGIFLVKYSNEAGLISDKVRVLLGGLFALALLAVGEVARRKENLSSIAPLPIANIPAILTAAGTAVAFATVYAAYALYGFLTPPVGMNSISV